MKLTYRADIDGIRAIAVLAIIFYHAGIKIFSGGFVGVDIFFVISGYLITTIILREINENEFSLAKFYERRIRRIFPALFATLLITLLTSALLFSTKEFKDFSQSLLATTLFTTNILFWSQSGYFDAPSTLKPLLHTWSLAVEEQFYIFFPLLLSFLARYIRPKLNLTLLGIALASFALNIYNLNHDTSGAFYLAHMRIWELLIGSLLATKMIASKINLHIGNLLSLIGLVMLAIPIFLYTNDTPFPGIAASIPTLGTALIIYSGIENKTFIGRILSFWPIVFIGQISYSLYLWHWPIIVFARYYAIIELTALETAAVLLIIFILSILSWHFIEKPFRQRSFLKNRGIFVYAAIGMVLTIAAGSAIYLTNGLPNRFSSRQADIDPNTDVRLKKWRSCGGERKKTKPMTGSAQTDTNATLFKLGLEQTVNKLLEMGRKVVIVTQVPEIGYYVPSAFSIAQRTGRDANKIIAPSLNEYIDRNMIVTTVVESLAKNDDVQIVDPWKALCNEKNCLVASEGQPLYLDDDHLSIFGAQEISNIFDPVFKNLHGQ